MDDQQQYAKDSVTLISELMQNTLGSQITTYFEGAPQEMPGEAAFPCLAVYKLNGHHSVGATTGDDVTEDIVIMIMTNRLIWEGSQNNIDTPMRHLQRLVEGKDPNSSIFYATYLPNTVMGALRKNLTLGTFSIDTDIEVNFDSLPRPNAPAIAECDLKLTITERVRIPNRS